VTSMHSLYMNIHQIPFKKTNVKETSVKETEPDICMNKHVYSKTTIQIFIKLWKCKVQ